jgi:uncharacterized paraquat-inducible protein A
MKKKPAEMFPDATKEYRLRRMLKKMNENNSEKQAILFFVAVLITVGFILLCLYLWSLAEFDSNPITGLFIIALVSLFFVLKK